MTDDITANDHRSRRCPMLGHDIRFAYCRQPGRDLPCGRIGDCWWEMFDVESFIRANYTDEQVRQILSATRPKILSLIELIQQARQAGDKKDQ
jgi:hypothetical protein